MRGITENDEVVIELALTIRHIVTDVHFVGSVALDTPEEVFAEIGRYCGPYLRRIPDGEPGGQTVVDQLADSSPAGEPGTGTRRRRPSSAEARRRCRSRPDTSTSRCVSATGCRSWIPPVLRRSRRQTLHRAGGYNEDDRARKPHRPQRVTTDDVVSHAGSYWRRGAPKRPRRTVEEPVWRVSDAMGGIAAATRFNSVRNH